MCELDESKLENVTLTFSVSQKFMKIPKSVHLLFQHFDFFLFHLCQSSVANDSLVPSRIIHRIKTYRICSK